MEITDVRIKLVNNSTDRLKAFCSVTLDDEFVIRDIKLVEGASGLFVAMPSRKLTASCPECRHKNPLRAHFCNECGADLPRLELPVDDHGRLRLYRDIAHPITPEFREKMQTLIVEAFRTECERSEDPNYEPASGVDLDDVVEQAGDASGNQQEESSEYAALIAGLDQGSQSSGNRSRGRTPERSQSDKAQESGGGRTRGERGDRPERRDDGRGGQKRRGGRRRNPNDERRDNVGKTRTAPAASISANEGSVKKPLFEKTTTPIKDPVSSTPRDEADSVSLSSASEDTNGSDSLEDTSVFGAGLL